MPANTGGALRALTLLQALDRALARSLQGDTRVVERTGPVDALFAEAMGFVLGCPAGYCRYGWFPSVLKNLLETEKFDFVHFDHPHTALSWPQIRRLQPQAKLV